MLAHEAVAQAVVVAARDVDGLEKPVAFVLPQPGRSVTEAELIESLPSGAAVGYRLHDAAIWEKAVRSLPLVAHWLDGQPIDDRVTAMAGAGWREEPVPAPSRTELLSIVAGD